MSKIHKNNINVVNSRGLRRLFRVRTLSLQIIQTEEEKKNLIRQQPPVILNITYGAVYQIYASKNKPTCPSDSDSVAKT